MKNILHLNSLTTGGAAEGAYRLHLNLKNKGYNSKFVVASKTIEDDDIIQVQPNYIRKLLRLEEKLLSKTKSKTNEQAKFFWPSYITELYSIERIVKSLPFKPDVIIAHWITNFISPKHLYEFNKYTQAPIVWYLMDMNPLTGGCHYAFDCHGYKRNCGYCPAFGGKKELDFSRYNWEKKYSYIQKTDVTIVSPTECVYNQVMESTLFSDKRKEKIMIGIDSNIFCPSSKELARLEMGLPINKKIVFFGAQSLTDKRKGIHYLIDALCLLEKSLTNNPELKQNIVIIFAGLQTDNLERKVPFPSKHIGVLKGNSALALAYQASDVFVCPSIEDSGPMMITESIMCGTPVVSFDMGAAGDLVHTGNTGYRAELKNASDLSDGIKQILELDEERALEMSVNCRNLALKHCTAEAQVRLFTKLFDTL